MYCKANFTWDREKHSRKPRSVWSRRWQLTTRSRKRTPKEAVAELLRADELSQEHHRIRGLLGWAYARAGQRAEAQKVLEMLKPLSEQHGYPLAIARFHAALGEKDEAFKWLQKACDD